MDEMITHDSANENPKLPRREGVSFDFDDVTDPLFILAPPRSFSSVVCAMLGQHPQMYGLPETHLFGDETLERWWGRSAQETYPMAHGLLRAIAQLGFGEQTESTVRSATGWLKRRSSFTSGMIFEELAREVYPSILIDKSPSIVYSLESMHRAYESFPRARFIHLLRHPRGHGDSVLKYLQRLAKRCRADLVPVPQWANDLACFPYPSQSRAADSLNGPETDPQRGWYVLNMNVVTFLSSVPCEQSITIRGEELLTDPDRHLRQIVNWMGLREDAEAIEEMKHPERSPYACLGPRGARYGNDLSFLEDAALRRPRVESHGLEGPLTWRSDGQGFLPEVKELARHFGYR
jgi:Sulfotransferase family